MFDDLLATTKSIGALVRFFSRPCTHQWARSIVVERLARRNELLLEMVWKAIWTHGPSPYARLLRWAGWSFDRLRESTERHGVESTLTALRSDGVYLTYEEFKGLQPIQRDGLTLRCGDTDFNNPHALTAYITSTGGTRHRMQVPASLDYLAANRVVARRLGLDAVGAADQPVLIWLSTGAGIDWWFALAQMGRPALRWFGFSPLFTPQTLRQRTFFRLAGAMGTVRLRGQRMPAFEHKPVSAATEVMEVLLDISRQQPRVIVVTTPSGATRLAGLALQSGVSLAGVTFVVQSEPLTPGKQAAIVRTGARAYARYGLVETGSVGEPCPNGADVDAVHLMAGCFGLVRDRRALPGGTAVDALLLTTLLPSSPKVLLNVETDDFADVATRRCGCLWDELGMHTCLSNIRSFSKLTGEGMTILGTDCVRILDEVLPQEFGGQSTDYQLLEVEDHEHLTRLRLVVSPSVGPVDEHRLLHRFIDELRRSIRTEGGLPPLWQQADSITVLRQEPVPTAGGKLFPFHTQAIQATRSRGRKP